MFLEQMSFIRTKMSPEQMSLEQKSLEHVF
jgi:hypothetical protein